MSKFPNKTSGELRRYFNQFDLAQLKKLNSSYIPHFEALERQIENCEEEVKALNERLNLLTRQKHMHEQTRSEVERHEAIFQSNLRSVLEISSRTDRYLGRQAAGDSPMNLYEYELFAINSNLTDATLRKKKLEETLADLSTKKQAAVSEVKILNDVIEEKEHYLAPRNFVRPPERI